MDIDRIRRKIEQVEPLTNREQLAAFGSWAIYRNISEEELRKAAANDLMDSLSTLGIDVSEVDRDALADSYPDPIVNPEDDEEE